MCGTAAAQTLRKDRNDGGHVLSESLTGSIVLSERLRGSGTEGGTVDDRNAPKKRHRAGPVRRYHDNQSLQISLPKLEQKHT